MSSIPTTSEEQWRFAKAHAPTELHEVIDTVFQFARDRGCEFYTRSPADVLGLAITWSAEDGVSRNVNLGVHYDTHLEEISVYVAAWRDDLTIRKRLYKGHKTHRLQGPIEPNELLGALEASYKKARSLGESDLEPATDLRWVTMSDS